MQESSFTMFPELSTERLQLRQITFDDKKAIFRLRSNKEINEFLEREIPKNLNQAEGFIQTCLDAFENENSIFWALVSQNSNQLIGTVALNNIDTENSFATIACEMNPDYQDEGYMSEAMKVVLDYAIMSLNVSTIEASAHHNNEAAIALLEKFLFTVQTEREDTQSKDHRIYKFGS